MKRSLRRAAPYLLLFALNLLFVGSTLLTLDPGNAWYKGPLIDPVSPYSPQTGFRLLGYCLAAMLDLTVLYAFVAYRMLLLLSARRRRKAVAAMTVVVLAGAYLTVEFGLRTYLDTAEQTMFVPDADYNWTLAPNLESFHNIPGGEHLSTNSLGWRAVEVPPDKGDDEVRVMTLGDSSGYGLGVEDDATWSARLEYYLYAELRDRQVTVFNTACPGHTTHQGVKILQRHLPRVQPDLVIVGYNNDPAPEFYTDAERERQAAWSMGLRRLAYRSSFYLVLRQVLIGVIRGHFLTWTEDLDGTGDVVTERPKTHRVPIDEYAANLRAMNRLVSDAGAQLILVRMPVNFGVPPLVDRFYDPDYIQVLQQESGDLGIPLVDVHQDWQQRNIEEFLLGHVFHPNVRGHGHIAELLIMRLRTMGWQGMITPRSLQPTPTPARDKSTEQPAEESSDSSFSLCRRMIATSQRGCGTFRSMPVGSSPFQTSTETFHGLAEQARAAAQREKIESYAEGL